MTLSTRDKLQSDQHTFAHWAILFYATSFPIEVKLPLKQLYFIEKLLLNFSTISIHAFALYIDRIPRTEKFLRNLENTKAISRKLFKTLAFCYGGGAGEGQSFAPLKYKNNIKNNRNNSLLFKNNSLLSFAPLIFSSRKPGHGLVNKIIGLDRFSMPLERTFSKREIF